MIASDGGYRWPCDRLSSALTGATMNAVSVEPLPSLNNDDDDDDGTATVTDDDFTL